MSVFNWCTIGQHEKCPQTFQKWILVPGKKRGGPANVLQYLDEWEVCECTKRSCKCYKVRKDAGIEKKPKPRKRKK